MQTLIHCLGQGSMADKPCTMYSTSQCPSLSVADITDCATSPARFYLQYPWFWKIGPGQFVQFPIFPYFAGFCVTFNRNRRELGCYFSLKEIEPAVAWHVTFLTLKILFWTTLFMYTKVESPHPATLLAYPTKEYTILPQSSPSYSTKYVQT